MRKKYSNQILAKVKEAYHAIAEEFDHTRQGGWEEFRSWLAFAPEKAKVLDLGCGNGRLYETLAGKKVHYIGIDNNSTLIEKARMNFPSAEFRLGDMTDLPFPPDSFDLVFSVASFHHIPSRDLRKKVIEDVRALLKPNGLMILSVWNLFQKKYALFFLKSIGSYLVRLGMKYEWNDLWVPWADSPLKRYYHAFTPRELKSCFSGPGWKIEKFYFSRQGHSVSFFKSFNLCLIVRKI